ncbi:hypothetical protein KIF24_16800 [Micromonospora sp. Llam7]|uniref:carbohydrate kinase family protein n=1 Tax=Micromonospora tarapacensis TaxID=2835305 RepID=UPI001C83B62D|nr:hypothetical protein [Micromonospora tarapacensis]
MVGSVSTDRISTAHRPPTEVLGGAGLYAALGAAAVGVACRVALAGVVGHGVAADAAGIITPRVEHGGLLAVAGPGLRFDIAYDRDWTAHYRLDGAEAEDAVGPHLLSDHPSPQAVHLCPTGPPEVQLNLATALRAGHAGQVLLSATTFRNRILAEPETAAALWRLVDLFVCDVAELRLLTDTSDIAAALRLACRITGDRATCVTDAHHGGYLIGDGATTPIPAFATRTVDPTGAGESFAGAVAAARMAGIDLPTAVRLGAATASITVEDFGVRRLALADPAEIRHRAAALAGQQRLPEEATHA